MITVPTLVFLLCLATSVGCALLLVRAYRRTRTRLLLWSALGFVGLAFNNLFLVVDLVLLPASVDLIFLRYGAAFIAVSLMICGFIWEAE